MKLDLAGINWLAVGVAALATFFLGAVWYAALFGKAWQRLNGHSDEKLAQMRRAKPPHVFMGGMLASYGILSIAVAILVVGFDVRGAGAGAVLGGVLWAGPALAIGVTSWLASDKPPGSTRSICRTSWCTWS